MQVHSKKKAFLKLRKALYSCTFYYTIELLPPGISPRGNNNRTNNLIIDALHLLNFHKDTIIYFTLTK